MCKYFIEELAWKNIFERTDEDSLWYAKSIFASSNKLSKKTTKISYLQIAYFLTGPKIAYKNSLCRVYVSVHDLSFHMITTYRISI